MWFLLLSLFTLLEGPAFRTVETPDPQVKVLVPTEPAAVDGRVDVVVHLKGSPELVAREIAAAGMRPVVIVVSDPGFSSSYARRYADPQTLADQIAAALAELPGDVEEGRLVIVSFSAGYGAVRELLKHDVWHERLDGLLMLDSIHAGFDDAANRRPAAEQMTGFRRFAEAAAAGEKAMVVVHALYAPPDYASTQETADDLLDHLGLEATPADEWIAEGLHVDRTARRGGFRVIGTSADDGSDHGRILGNLHLWLPAAFPASNAE